MTDIEREQRQAEKKQKGYKTMESQSSNRRLERARVRRSESERPWVTIGGRIEDFAAIAKARGLREAKSEITKVYGDESASVYEGLKAFIRGGIAEYYGACESGEARS